MKQLINKSLFYFLLVFFIGLISGFFIKNNFFKDNVNSENNSEDSFEIRQSGYKFINPLLECEIANGKINKVIYSFKNELIDLINDKTKNGDINSSAIYFRDLNNGPWFGINEKEMFLPASLLKVPIMMTYYKFAESDPQILTKKIKFQTKYTLEQNKIQFIAPEQEIELGKEYTVAELIERTIKYSDNQALVLLNNNMPDNYLKNLFKILGVEDDVLKRPNGTLSVKSYATFFRILYNTSYLNHEYSEKALQLLSEVSYNKALRAGVPQEIIVAHKFGESGYDNGERELHDCGIIYHPQKPYMLCIMTKGKDLDKMENTIKDISRFTYDQVNKNISNWLFFKLSAF